MGIGQGDPAEPIGVDQRQRLDHQQVDEAEDDGIRPDRQRQGEHRRGGKGRRAEHEPRAVLEVAQQIRHVSLREDRGMSDVTKARGKSVFGSDR